MGVLFFLGGVGIVLAIVEYDLREWARSRNYVPLCEQPTEPGQHTDARD